jgi:starch synthase
MSKNEQLKILFVATEVSPYSKSGGLGDVAGSLPQALRARGADVRVCFPKYKSIPSALMEGAKKVASFTVHLSWREQPAKIYALDGSSNPSGYVIENDFYFGRDSYYGFADDYERFAFFAKAAVEMLSYVEFKADIIHLNDWQTGLGCTYLRDIYRGFSFYKDMKSLFTIHNLQYAGIFGREVLWNIGLNDGYFTDGDLEFFGNISYLKAGVNHSDAVSTVSETYAKEIQTPAYGFGMDGLLRKRGEEDGRLFGIVNGIDTNLNDPATDPRIFAHYDAENIGNKYENKRKLQESLSLPSKDVPIFGVVSRLTEQKGFDIVGAVLDELMTKDVQFILLGTGEGRYENLFRTYEWRYPDKIRSIIGYDEKIAQRIYAGADIYLMPSRFEPCGLSQIFAMRYGTIPVVRKTGGLVDTVKHFNRETKQGTGFVFEDFLPSGLMWAINEALAAYNTEDWPVLVKNAMSDDFSWDYSAGEYIRLYKKIINSNYA